jgi:hypothetical protein
MAMNRSVISALSFLLAQVNISVATQFDTLLNRAAISRMRCCSTVRLSLLLSALSKKVGFSKARMEI